MLRSSIARYACLLCALVSPCIASGFMIRMVADWHTVHTGWRDVPAEILAVQLEESPADGQGAFHRIAAEYAYVWEGRRHIGTRVSLFEGNDTIGSFHADAVAELQAHMRDKRPFPCRVNPANPSESVLYDTLRPELLAFAGVFFILSVLGVFVIAGILWWMPRAVHAGRLRHPKLVYLLERVGLLPLTQA